MKRRTIPIIQVAIWDNYCHSLDFCLRFLVVMDECIIKPFLRPDDSLDEKRLHSSFDLYCRDEFIRSQ